MSGGKFVRGTALTYASGILILLVGVGISVILARALGPEGKGEYALAALLSSVIVILGNLGIGSATAYYIASGEYRRQEILGNTLIFSFMVSSIGIIVGLAVVVFFGQKIFPDVAQKYLLLALALIPAEILYQYTRFVLLGAQKIKQFNYAEIAKSILFLVSLVITLLVLKTGVAGALVAALLSYLMACVLSFHWAKVATAGIVIAPNASYMKQAAKYGLQFHLSNVLSFFNYRVDMLLISVFLGSSAVGLYSIGVGLVEQLWMISSAASIILFARVAAEKDEQGRKEFTPLVARTVLWTTALGALALAFLSRWIILLLYSEAYLPAVGALQALLAGIVVLSASMVLSHDIAGRGRPGLNIYPNVAAVAVNVVLNILWIPRYGITGAGWASTVSYTVLFLGTLFFYCSLSGNNWGTVILPQRGDLAIYRQTVAVLTQWAYGKLRGIMR